MTSTSPERSTDSVVEWFRNVKNEAKLKSSKAEKVQVRCNMSAGVQTRAQKKTYHQKQEVDETSESSVDESSATSTSTTSDSASETPSDAESVPRTEIFRKFHINTLRKGRNLTYGHVGNELRLQMCTPCGEKLTPAVNLIHLLRAWIVDMPPLGALGLEPKIQFDLLRIVATLFFKKHEVLQRQPFPHLSRL